MPPGGARKGALSHPEVKASMEQLPWDKCSLEGQVEGKAGAGMEGTQVQRDLECPDVMRGLERRRMRRQGQVCPGQVWVQGVT